MLNTVGKSLTKANRRTVARPAAKILQDDMRAGSGGEVPIYKNGKYHYFKSGNFNVRIRAGNLRKAHKMMTFNRSGLMWVGAKYGAAVSGGTIGETYRTADGFYDKMYIAKTGKRYHERALARKATEIKRSLIQHGEAWMRKIVNKANATP
jgi:hypothetical protein